jgi:hypothetical protein
LLGVDVDSDASLLQKNFEKSLIKMQKIVNFWDRFNLSFAGRIKIAKCFLLAQVNYLGSILMPTENLINQMQFIMDNFCTGTLRISKEKLYSPPEQGGVGLINISHTLVAQQSIWFKRASISTRDNWRVVLWECGSGNCLTVDPDLLSPEGNPILFGLADSFRTFAKSFYLKDNNFLSSYILNNPCITVESGFPYPVNTRFWDNNAANLAIISKLKFSDLLSNGRLKPLAVLNLETGASLSFVTYIRLSGIVSRALTLFVKNGQKSITLFNFFSGFKKGSKNLRKILQDKNNNQLQRVWHAFAEVARIADPDPVPDHFGKILSIWNLNCLPNSFRDFIFKFFHNRLGLNSRTANFLDHNNWCTFCSIVGLQMGPFDSETFLHFLLTVQP